MDGQLFEYNHVRSAAFVPLFDWWKWTPCDVDR